MTIESRIRGADGWSRTIDQRNFRLVVAQKADEPVGFAFGLPLQARTKWWHGALTPLPDEVTAEYPGRTFAACRNADKQVALRWLTKVATSTPRLSPC